MGKRVAVACDELELLEELREVQMSHVSEEDSLTEGGHPGKRDHQVTGLHCFENGALRYIRGTGPSNDAPPLFVFFHDGEDLAGDVDVRGDCAEGSDPVGELGLDGAA